jgi:quinol monooxygenase YgiN
MHRIVHSFVTLGFTLLACLLAWPAMADERGTIIVVTHIDVIPTNLDQAVPVLKNFAAESKDDPGVVSFQLITWAPTTNHFQLIQIYNSLGAFNRHVQASHTIRFRSAIQPFIGAPYDERIYIAAGQELDPGR